MIAKTMHKKNLVWKLLVPATALCFLIAAPPLAAQDQGQGQGQEQKQEYNYGDPDQTDKDFSEGDLEKFAAAQDEVAEIRQEYSEELSEVEDTEKARDLQDKYAQQMVDAIKEIGIDVQTYNKISMAMQNDPELKEKIENMTN